MDQTALLGGKPPYGWFYVRAMPRGLIGIVCADSVTRGLVRDHPSMNMKIGTLVPGYVLSANLSL